jgi:Four helix bundle sensory module for signal transduction
MTKSPSNPPVARSTAAPFAANPASNALGQSGSSRLALARSLTTPQRFQVGLYGIWGTGLLFGLTAVSAVQSQRQAIQTVAYDSAPSVYVGKRVLDSLEDMDANAANILLAAPGKNPDAIKAFEKRRDDTRQRIVMLAKNITIPEEQDIVNRLQTELDHYGEVITRAQLLHTQGNRDGALIQYREALDILETQLLPQAEKITQLNFRSLESAYRSQQQSTIVRLVGIFLSGALFLAVLVSLQTYLSRRTRRTLNPALLGATALAALYVLQTIIALSQAAQQTRIAKEDAFDSLYALRTGRALAYSANADESRYLLDPQLSETRQAAFTQKIQGVQANLNKAIANTTFVGEGAALRQTQSTLLPYLQIDQQIRTLKNSGKLADAIALCVGNDPGDSNYAFQQFLDAHNKVLNINLFEFDRSVMKALGSLDSEPSRSPFGRDKDVTREGKGDLLDKVIVQTERSPVDGFWVKTSGYLGAIALLSFFGVRPRMQEYKR